MPAELRQRTPPPAPLTPGYADGHAAGAPSQSATPADLLTHAADYGAWCQDVANQRDALLKLLNEEAR